MSKIASREDAILFLYNHARETVLNRITSGELTQPEGLSEFAMAITLAGITPIELLGVIKRRDAGETL